MDTSLLHFARNYMYKILYDSCNLEYCLIYVLYFEEVNKFFSNLGVSYVFNESTILSILTNPFVSEGINELDCGLIISR